MNLSDWEADSYHSKDFSWDLLREEVENDSCLQFHFEPYPSANIANQNQDDRLSKAWDKFHARHFTGKFFKERRYLLKEFPELASRKHNIKVLEVGCGNGSTALPILRGRENIMLYACDCSNAALERTKEIVYAADSISKTCFLPFLWDISTTMVPPWLVCSSCSLQKHQSGSRSNETSCCIGGVDFVSLIFTLSALPLDKMPKAMAQCFSVLKAGGLLLFRDYGLYDMTMLRFKPELRIGYREYSRLDGTRSYFFCLETVRNLATAAGFTEVELEYCCVKSINRRSGKIMKRVWVHGKFQKPFV